MAGVVALKHRHLDIPELLYEDRLSLINSPLFENSCPALQNNLLENGFVRKRQKGEHLFMEGDEVDSMFFLLTGKAREYYPTSDGNDCQRQIFCPGKYISLHRIFSSCSIYSYSCEALSNTVSFCWKMGHLRRLVQQEPGFGCQVANILSNYIESSCRHNCLCRKTQALARVSGFLLSKYQAISRNNLRISTGRNQTIEIDLRPLAFSANDICLARETFSRALSSLQDRGLIRVKFGRIELLDIESLKRLSGICD